MVKKSISIFLACTLCLSALFSVFSWAEETQWEQVAAFNAEQLSTMPAGDSALSDARIYENGLLTTATDGNGIINAPVENVAGYAQKMFGETHIAWGFCTPMDGQTHNIRVVVRAGLYTFDDDLWQVNQDGYLDQLDFFYDSYNMVGFSLAENMLWYDGEGYNALPTKCDSSKGYYYKEFEFTYSDVPEWSNGKVYFNWDYSAVTMSMGLNKATYYDAGTGEILREVDEEDIAYGTLENLTGIVHTDHTYTTLSCGEVFMQTSYEYFITDISADLLAGDYKFNVNIDTPKAVLEIHDGENKTVKTYNISTSGMEEVSLDFSAGIDAGIP